MIKTYNNIVNFLSFSGDLRKMRRTVNQSIDLPEVIEEFPDSHPRGFIKEFKKRRTTIIETYLRITKSLESANYKERVDALNLLAEHIIYSRSLKMPLNAARVQLALMKKVMKNRENKRKQLELMRDFTESSFGHPRSIRKFLKKLDIIEVPETGSELRDLKMGWDFHVHDNTSYGRKEPIQLIIDAFIKGISELTIAYNNFNSEDTIKEVLDAGRILGIKVNTAIEFSALTNGKRFHYMYILPNFSSKKKRFKKFLKQKADGLQEFLHELEENENKRKLTIHALINNFNNKFLPKINESYNKDSIYFLKPLSGEKQTDDGEFELSSRRQLGEYLYSKMKRIFEKRALQITSLKNKVDNFPKSFSEKEITEINSKYLKIRKEYKNLSAENLRIKYFSHTEKTKVETAVSSLKDIFKLAQNSGAGIKFIQPLEHGLQAAVNMILENYKMLSHTEIFNMYDSIDTKEAEFIAFAEFIKLLNTGKKEALIIFFQKNALTFDNEKLEEASAFTSINQFIPTLGSDATGSSTLVPGMGFVLESQIPKEQLKQYKNHYSLPSQISDFIYKKGDVPKLKIDENHKETIVCLGQIDKNQENELGDEKNERFIKISKVWEYLNPAVRNWIFILIGFVPAYLTVGIEYAALWFTITGTRNIFVDLIAGNGFRPKEWSIHDINWTNLANSLFWTGFSVPILGFVKAQFDIFWSWEHIGGLYEFMKFFFINTANGMYLATHNYIRGFDKGTIKGNFFRSILAWPLAAAFAPIGNAMMLPSIVQAKFWSDFVAAIIEGSGKYKNLLQVKNRVMNNLLPELGEPGEAQKLAVLDLIYFTNESTRAQIALKKIIVGHSSFLAKIKGKAAIKEEKEIQKQYHSTLLNWFEDDKNYEKLSDFIIKNYNKEQSVFLLNLISENYIKFYSWLKKLS